MDFEKLIMLLQTRKIFVYGYGGRGQKTEQILQKLGTSPYRMVFWDNDVSKHRMPSIEGKTTVHSPTILSLTQVDKDEAVFFTAIDQLSETLHFEMQQAGCKNIYNARILEYVALQWLGEDLVEYISKSTDSEFLIDYNKLIPAIDDIGNSAGKSLAHRDVLQNLWAAKKVYSAKPLVHYDIGSSINEFICHLLSFQQKVVLIDIRPLDTVYIPDELSFIQADATELEGIEDGSIDSISAICSIEHFGLGRYGDPINPNAHLTAFKALQRVVSSCGNIYISLPLSRNNEVWFNAKRSYAPQWLIQFFGDCRLNELSLAIDGQGLMENVSADEAITICEKNDIVFALYHFVKL